MSNSSYRVSLSFGSLVATFAAACVFAFGLGQTARHLDLVDDPFSPTANNLLSKAFLPFYSKEGDNTISSSLGNDGEKGDNEDDACSVDEISMESKEYKSRSDGREEEEEDDSEDDSEDEDDDSEDDSEDEDDDSDDDSDDEDEELTAVGELLQMDFKFLEKDFLKSESRLVNAMVKFVEKSGLALLSHHCHQLNSEGLNCVGVLERSDYLSLYTWPEDGVMALNLYTSGSNSLVPVMPLAKDIFSFSSDSKHIQPQIRWASKLRGFLNDDAGDLTNDIVGSYLDYKEEIVSVRSTFQEITVYDVVEPGRTSQESIESMPPDRNVFLSGVLQSTRNGDAAYHEALVHPTLFAHPNPQRVAIIGGGEGATLREILKHSTIEKVVMIEIDELMVNASRQFLPEWNDCSNLVGRSKNCFDDPKVELYCEDAFAWFKDRFYSKEDITEDLFDVIIMDALDPQGVVEIVGALYSDKYFYPSIANALLEDGIFISQIGESDSMKDPPLSEYSNDRHFHGFLQGMMSQGFTGFREYAEPGCGFGDPWAFMVAFKQHEAEANWFRTEAQLDVEIRKRVVPTLDGRNPLLYFDGATMKNYRFPSKITEVTFCRADPPPADCQQSDMVEPKTWFLPDVIPKFTPSIYGILQSMGEKRHKVDGAWSFFDDLKVDNSTGNQILYSPKSDRSHRWMPE